MKESVLAGRACMMFVLLSFLVTAPTAFSEKPGVTTTMNSIIRTPQILSLGKGLVNSVNYSADGTMLAAGGQGKVVRIWSTSDWKILRDLKHPGMIIELAFSASGILATTFDSSFENNTSYVWLWDVHTGTKLGAYAENQHIITSIAFSEDAKLLGVGLNNGLVRLLDVRDPAHIKVGNPEITSFDSGVSSLCFSPDGTLLAASTYKGMGGPKDKGKVKIFDVRSGQEILTYSEFGNVFNLAFSPDSKRLAIAGIKLNKGENGGSTPGLLLVSLDTKNWILAEASAGHPVGAGLAFSENGRFVISAYPNPPDAAVVVWDSRTQRIIKSINDVSSITCFDLKGTRLAVGDETGTIHLYSLKIPDNS